MRQNPHVRICGGPGSATTLVYPTSVQAQVRPPVPAVPVVHIPRPDLARYDALLATGWRR